MDELFRKNALDSISTPEQLDRQVKIVRPSFWVIGIILLAGLITFVLWSFTYHISNGINMQGVIFTKSDVRALKADRECIITDVFVKEDDFVFMGDIIATVSCDELLDEISVKMNELSLLEKGSAEYLSCEEKIEELRNEYKAKTSVYSTCYGYVQSVGSVGTALKAGDTVSSLINAYGFHEVIAYVPMQKATNLNIGMKAQVSPVYAPREEYGYMTGTITEITSSPVTKENILEKMGTLSYVENILPDTACVEVHIKLDMDEGSANAYQWSNPKGSTLPVGVGTQCSIIAITDEYRPVELLF